MSRILSLATFVVAFTSLLLSSYCEAAAPAKQRTQSGRYQLVTGFNGTIYVIDTATAQCWSRGPDGWTDLGNPFDPRPERTPAPLSLKLPGEPVELTVLQRRSKVIPGSEGRILLRLGDITAEQVLLSVESHHGEVLLDDTSVERGEVVRFRVAEKTFYIRLRELTNVLLGSDDFGVFEIWPNPPPVESTSKDDGGDEKSGVSEATGIEDAEAESESKSSR